MYVRGGDPQRFAMRLRELAQTTDPTVRVIATIPVPSFVDADKFGTMSVFKFMISLTIVTLR